MKQQPTREQVLDALQTHKTIQKAAKALGLSYPKMQYCLRTYGICTGHAKKVCKPKQQIIVIPERKHGWSAVVEWFKKKFSND